MIKHIMIDIVGSNEKIRENIMEILERQCAETYSAETLRVFICKDVLVEIKSYTSYLLMDLIGGGDHLFDQIIRALPRTNVVIRLIERGS